MIVNVWKPAPTDATPLLRLAREHGWTDKTPVPPDVFNPDFKPTGKSWWKVW